MSSHTGVAAPAHLDDDVEFGEVDLSVATRATRRRWWRHALSLAAVIVGVAALSHNGAILSADEGVMLLQGRVVIETGQWGLPGVDTVDLDREWFAMESAMRGDTQWFLVAKTPAYPLLVGWLDAVGGLWLVVLVHAAALWMTALLCGRLAENLRPGLGIPVLWAVGVGSPMFFDGFWVIAHAFGTLGMAMAALGVWRWLERRRPDGLLWVAAGVTVTLLFRSEGVLAGLALAAGLAAVGPRRWLRAAPAAAIAGGLSVAVYRLGPAVQTRLLGGEKAYAFAPTYGESSLIGSRIQAFEATVTSGGRGLPGLLAALAALLFLGCVAAWRLGAREALVRLLGGASIAVGVVRLLVQPDLISGLAVACPVAFAGWFLLDRRHLGDPFLRVAGATALAGFAAVQMTQYRYGGVGEWGGRYFHVILPFAAVVVSVAVWDRWTVSRHTALRHVMVAGVALSMLWAGAAVRAHVSLRSGSEALNRDVWAAAIETESADQPGGPVIVSTWSPAGRFMWDRVMESRFLTVTETRDYRLLGERLAAAGVPDAVVIVEPGRNEVIEALGAGWSVSDSVAIKDGDWRAVTVRRAGG